MWRRFSERMVPLAKSIPLSRLQWITFSWILAMTLLNFLIAAPLLNIFGPIMPWGRVSSTSINCSR